MAWCFYKDLKRKVGAHLRVMSLDAEIVQVAPADESVWQVVVVDRRKGTATLRVWSLRAPQVGKPQQHTVTVITVAENQEWVVER